MRESDLVPLQCSRQTLAALAAGLSKFGPTEGEPDWLVSGVWLCTSDRNFVATSSTIVLADGYVARTLAVHSPQGLADTVAADLPDIEDRLNARGVNVPLGHACGAFGPPAGLCEWDCVGSSTKVLIRVAERLLTTRRVACGLLFESAAGRSLLVGTDTTTMAMVVSEDEPLIDRYRQACDEVAAAEFSSFA